MFYNFATNLKGSNDWFSSAEEQIENYELGPLHRSLRKRSTDVQYSAPRPLYSWKSEELIRLVTNGLKRSWPSIELPSLALSELMKRHRTSDCNSVKELFKSKNISPINWLESLNSLLRKELNVKSIKQNTGRNKSNFIYFILLDFNEENKGYGLYIGSSIKKVKVDNEINQDSEVAQHFRGLKNNFDCKMFGVEPLWSLSTMFNTSDHTKKQLLLTKSKIHTLARTIVPVVFGERPYLDLLREDEKFSKMLQREC